MRFETWRLGAGRARTSRVHRRQTTRRPASRFPLASRTTNAVSSWSGAKDLRLPFARTTTKANGTGRRGAPPIGTKRRGHSSGESDHPRSPKPGGLGHQISCGAVSGPRCGPAASPILAVTGETSCGPMRGKPSIARASSARARRIRSFRVRKRGRRGG